MKAILASLAFLLTACSRPVAAPPSVTPSSSTTSATPSTASRPSVAGGITIKVPDSIADFALVRRHDYDDKALGTQLRYRGPDSLIADVYIYPGPDLRHECPLACAEARLTEEVTQFEREIPVYIQRGYFQSGRVIARQALTPAQDAAWQLGHHLLLDLVRGGMAQRSEFYLYYLPGYRVKLRATYVDDPSRRAALERLVKALVPTLVRSELRPT